MRLRASSVNGFRNLSPYSIDWSNQCNVLLGKNGQGKTSALESIYLLGSGRSFRTSANIELVSFTHDRASVEGAVESHQLELLTQLRVEIVKKSKTKFFVHDKEASLSNGYLSKLIVVAFAPSDTEIIRGGPSIRRRFLDKHLVDIYPNHLGTLLRYQKALKSKLSLLASGTRSPQLLDPWDLILAECSAQITSARCRFLSELEAHLGAILPLIAPNDGAVTISLKKSSFEEAAKEPSAEQYFEAIQALRPKEIITQKALLGPHRDDVSISLSGVAARDFASQGQARTLTLLLKLSVIELIEKKTAESPVILLDDVDSELDEGRARFLFDVFSEKSRQLFISSTNQSDLWPKAAQIYNLDSGRITPQ